MKKNEYIIEISVPVRVCNLCGREISPKIPYWEVVPAGEGSPMYFHGNCRSLVLFYSDLLRGIAPTEDGEAPGAISSDAGRTGQ